MAKTKKATNASRGTEIAIERAQLFIKKGMQILDAACVSSIFESSDIYRIFKISSELSRQLAEGTGFSPDDPIKGITSQDLFLTFPGLGFQCVKFIEAAIDYYDDWKAKFELVLVASNYGNLVSIYSESSKGVSSIELHPDAEELQLWNIYDFESLEHMYLERDD